MMLTRQIFSERIHKQIGKSIKRKEEQMHTLYPYEEDGVKFLSTRKTAYLGDDMGLGKTVQAIRSIHAVVSRITAGAANKQLPMPMKADFGVIVVAPAHLLAQWRNQIEEQLPKDNFGFRFRLMSYNCAVNYWAEVIDEDFEGRNADILIFDEAHYLKTLDSQRSQALLGRDGLVHKANRIWMLSGTPITNKPIEIWHILKTLAPWCLGKYTDRIEFGKRFCKAFWDGRSWDMSGHSNESELGTMLKSWMLRRNKAEVLPFLPPVREEIIPVPFDQSMFEEIMFESAIVEIEADGGVEERKIPDIGSLPTLRRLIGMSKRKTVTDHIKNILESNKKACVYGYHPALLEYIRDNVGAPCDMIIGGMSSNKREEEKRKFIEDKNVRLFLGQMEAAGEGLDGLQSVCDFLLFVEPDWLPKTHKQVIGRLHRIGQTGSSVTVQYIVAQGTVEENIMRSQLNKQTVIERIVE